MLGLGRSPARSHGSPLQCSCPENPKFRGVWRATVSRVAESWTWLKWLSMPAHAWWSVLSKVPRTFMTWTLPAFSVSSSSPSCSLSLLQTHYLFLVSSCFWLWLSVWNMPLLAVGIAGCVSAFRFYLYILYLSQLEWSFWRIRMLSVLFSILSHSVCMFSIVPGAYNSPSTNFWRFWMSDDWVTFQTV